MQIDGSTVLLTGATGGLGSAIARELSSHGAKLILTGRQTDVLGTLSSDLRAHSQAVDLGDRQAIEGLLEQSGDVDILVANAGLAATGSIEELSVQEIDQILDVNLRAPIVMAKALAPAMIARGFGHLVFVSSLSGKASSPLSSLYSATKFGLRGFALALRQDLRSSGIGVSVVCPGFIREAGMFAQTNVKLPRGVGTRSPQDVASAVAKAITRDLAEVDVAPLPVRAGATFANVAPGIAAAVTRKSGGDELARAVNAGHRAR
jgi:uncharacterized protein